MKIKKEIEDIYMDFNKIKILKILLYLGSIFFIIGTIAHFFGLTIFPFYVHALHSQYHDTLLAMLGITLSIIFYTIAKNPKKNIDVLNGLIICGIIVIIFNIWIIWKIDFVSLGAPAKKFQTIVETIIAIIYVVLLKLFKPNTK